MKSIEQTDSFFIHSPFKPAGDQPQAIEALVQGIQSGLDQQVLLGVTGSGKTFTIAHVIKQVMRPALILAPNKTLAAQLYGEFKSFFPKNAVEYFVSYYDYYQPEAYVPASDMFIEKDSSINKHVEQMRLSATKALLERRDAIIVATVSAIYGLGDPQSYLQMTLPLKRGEPLTQRDLIHRLVDLQYQRDTADLQRGSFRVRGDSIDIYPAESDKMAVRVELWEDCIEQISIFDPLTGHVSHRVGAWTVFPSSHYVTPRDVLLKAVDRIKEELPPTLESFYVRDKLVEAQRLEQRTRFDLEMMLELGYCSGIENYSRHFSGRSPGAPPPTLLDYLSPDALIIIDESHVTLPQIGAMYKGDRSRKETLVNYGFRLPSALDNRPLTGPEFEARRGQTIYVSATPGPYERENADVIVEQVVRPTGLLDPIVEVRSALTQVDDVLSEINHCVAKKERVLITTLTKRMAEDLTAYLTEHGVKVRYLHADIDTVERVQIIHDLRLGTFDVLVGINLLREGLDMPEVSLVAILDADKQGFLRSERSLIQTMGRAARHLSGKAILYADKITAAMQSAIDETQRRRMKQQAYNDHHAILPKGIQKPIQSMLDIETLQTKTGQKSSKIAEKASLYDKMIDPKIVTTQLVILEKKMQACAHQLHFEEAAKLRDQIQMLKKKLFGIE